MTGTFNPLLVLLSVIVAIFASYTALNLVGRVSVSSGAVRRTWLWGGAISMGIGIWSMHFVGMLALHLPVAVAYDVVLWLLSVAIAIVASLVALTVAGRPVVSTGALLAAAGVMGVAIAGMHYTGMA